MTETTTPVELWLHAGDTLAGFVPSEGFNCVALRVQRQGSWTPILSEPPNWQVLRARPSFYGSPLLVPYVYGLRDGILEFGGQQYTIRQGKERRSNHGFSRDYAWTVTETRQDEREATLRAHLAVGAGDPASDARLPEFPFPLKMEVTYILRPRELVTRFCITNLGDATLPLGVGIHPYFDLSVRSGRSDADMIAQGRMTRLLGDPRFAPGQGLGGYDASPDYFSQPMDRYIALAAPDRAILDLFERNDQPSEVEGEGKPLWTLDNHATGLAAHIRASADFRFIGQFVPGDRSVLSPVVSTNRPDGFGVAARGGDGGLIELAAGESWQGWGTLAISDAPSAG